MNTIKNLSLIIATLNLFFSIILAVEAAAVTY